VALSAGVTVLLDQVSDTQLQAGRILAGAVMVAFLGAPFVFRRRAQAIRLVVTVIYIAAVLAFLLYVLLWH
jgi:hypothetical protein